MSISILSVVMLIVAIVSHFILSDMKMCVVMLRVVVLESLNMLNECC